jgi:hypothetical protein
VSDANATGGGQSNNRDNAGSTSDASNTGSGSSGKGGSTGKGTPQHATQSGGGSSGFECLSTKDFDRAELAAKHAAEKVRDLKLKIQTADFAASQRWLGKGHQEFKKFAYTIEIQLKDISDEFWDFYEELIEVHDAYLTADEEAATAVNSAKQV